MLSKEIVSYLIPFPPTSHSLGFRLATLIFTKTRLCSHISFIGRCLESKVIPKGFAQIFTHLRFHLQTSNTFTKFNALKMVFFPRNIMRIIIRAICTKRDDLDKQILQCCNELSKICPSVLVHSIRSKIQELKSKLFNHLYQIKTKKLQQLIGPPATSDPSFENNDITVVTLPGNLPLSDSERSVLR